MQTSTQLRQALIEVEEGETRAALVAADGSPARAAVLLGISKPTVYRRMKKYGIEIKRVIQAA